MVNTIVEFVNDNEEGRRVVKRYKEMLPHQKWRKVKIEITEEEFND